MSGGTLAAAGNNPLNKRILSAPADSELCFCMPQIFAAYKKARITYKKITMANGKSGRPKAKDPKTHRYNFKLNDEQELHFRKMLEEAGYRENISKFILARLFG